MLEFVDDIILNKRREICKSCEAYKSWLDQCQICGCFITFKTKFAAASCPILKWDSVKQETQQP